MRVSPCKNSEVFRWLETKHYSRRVPIIQFSFVGFEAEKMVGVVTFAPPSSPQVARSMVGDEHRDCVLELNRLVIDSDDKNAASKLIAGAIKLLPKPRILVSYADGRAGHVGYVYQATNWLYCGEATAHDCEYIVNGRKLHPRTLAAEGIKDPKRWARDNGVERVAPKSKHRYVLPIGSKREKKYLLSLLRWDVENKYPKGNTARHKFSDGAYKNVQESLI